MQDLYNKERARVRNLINRYIKKGFTFTKPIIPKIPKVKTQESIDELKKITPDFIKNNASSLRQPRTSQQPEKKTKKQKSKSFFGDDKGKKGRKGSFPSGRKRSGKKRKTTKSGTRKPRSDKGTKRGSYTKSGKPRKVRSDKGVPKPRKEGTKVTRKKHEGARKTRSDKGTKRTHYTRKKSRTETSEALPKSHWVLQSFMEYLNKVSNTVGGDLCLEFFNRAIARLGEDKVADIIDQAIAKGLTELEEGFDSEQLFSPYQMNLWILRFIDVAQGGDGDVVTEEYRDKFEQMAEDNFYADEYNDLIEWEKIRSIYAENNDYFYDIDYEQTKNEGRRMR